MTGNLFYSHWNKKFEVTAEVKVHIRVYICVYVYSCVYKNMRKPRMNSKWDRQQVVNLDEYVDI